MLDTNVLVDALCFSGSFGRQAFDLVRAQGDILYSMATLAELIEVIYRPRLQSYIEEYERRRFIVLFRRQAVLVDPAVQIRVCRDEKDDKFLEVAVSGNADAIITRDRALLELHAFQGIRIVEPKSFLDV